MNPEKTYSSRIRILDEDLRALRKADISLIVAKLLIFAAGVISLYRTAVAATDLTLALNGIFASLFIIAAVVHGRILSKKKHQEILREINTDELKSLDGSFLDVDDGREFIDEDHPFSSDLDLFGHHGLFHCLNRTATGLGKSQLADWLQAPLLPPHEEILRRQNAARELAALVELRHRIRAHGASQDGTLKTAFSPPCLFEAPYFLHGKKILTAAISVLPLLTLLAGLSLFIDFPRFPLYILIVVSIALAWKWERRCAQVYRLTEQGDTALRTYARVLAEIESAGFEDRGLRELQAPLLGDGIPASRRIRRLSGILGSFELRRSVLHALLNPLLLWDLRCVRRIEKWRKAAEGKIPGWFRAAAEIDALASFANLAFNNPEWTFPKMQDEGGGFRFRADSLGTPLIPPKERVTNDFDFAKIGSIGIITGPNMAGKSTFLKTVGVNMVLSGAGAPVCATRLEICPARLITSMKVSDSLEKGMSLFYAELRRLKMILEPIAAGEGVFFLVDEMLKGTNALDRQKGSIALLRQLAEREVPGLVATHDLQLAELEDAYRGRIANYHFDGAVKDDRLVFDYKLKRGRCESFNALILMRRMGIDV